MRNPRAPVTESREPRGETSGGDESFTACLNRHIRRSGLSLSQLAHRSWTTSAMCHASSTSGAILSTPASAIRVTVAARAATR